MADKLVKEQLALKLSLYAGAAFVLMALVFAVITHSDTILFDGIYSLIAFFLALLTLKVSDLVVKPDDERFHFGYSAFEPTLNLFKSLIIIVTCVFAVVSSINSLLTGGNSAEYGISLIYGFIATVGCFTVAWIMNRYSKSVSSELVGVDARTWFIDGLLSASILIGFIGAWWLESSPFADYAAFVDPVLLIILGLAILPVPVKIMLKSLEEVLNRAPSNSVIKDVEKRLHKTLIDIEYEHVEVRVSKRGRKLYLLIHVMLAEGFPDKPISELDEIRRASQNTMSQWNPELVMDMLFVRDSRLID